MDIHTKKPNEKLKYQRESRGWSQRRVAVCIETSPEMISRWECGERKPSLSYQERLCVLFEQDAATLGFIEDDPAPTPMQQMSYVLDASALLTFLQEEPGHEQVAQALRSGAVMSTINFSEAIGIFSENGISEKGIHDILDSLGIDLIELDEKQAYKAGLLHSLTKHLGLSFGERACLALAQHLHLPVIAADRLWARLSLDIEIQVIR